MKAVFHKEENTFVIGVSFSKSPKDGTTRLVLDLGKYTIGLTTEKN